MLRTFDLAVGQLKIYFEALNKELKHLDRSKAKSSRCIIQSKVINEAVTKYVKRHKHPYTARDISDNLYHILGVKVPALFIRRILKEQLGMSFKLGKYRPFGYDEDKASMMKGLFSIKVSRIIKNYDILINIDESMFSRTTKANYSWSEKGKESKLMNIWFSNSTSLITVITSFGDTLSANINGSVTNTILIKFLQELQIFLTSKIQTQIRNWLIIVDNASIHRCKAIKSFIKQENLSIAYIPPYSPEMAPVEKYFSVLKKNVIKQNIGRQINWRSENAKEILRNGINKISAQSVRNMWKTFTYEVKKNLEGLIELV